MSTWNDFFAIVKEEREQEILDLAAKAKVPTSVKEALVGAMTVARVVLEHREEIKGGETAACGLWEGCDEGSAVCPFFDKETDECGIPNQTESDIEAAMKVYRKLWKRMPGRYQNLPVLYVEM